VIIITQKLKKNTDPLHCKDAVQQLHFNSGKGEGRDADVSLPVKDDKRSSSFLVNSFANQDP